MEQDWQPAGRGKHSVFKRGPKHYRVQLEGWCSKVYPSFAEALRMGMEEYTALQQGNRPADANAAGEDLLAAQPAAAAAAGKGRQKRAGKQRAPTDAKQQPEPQQQPLPPAPPAAAAAAAAAAAGPKGNAKKRRQAQDPPAAAAAAGGARNKRQKQAAASPAAQGRPGSHLAAAGAAAAQGELQEQSPSAATDAATGQGPKPPPKQQRKPAQPPKAPAPHADAVGAAAGDQLQGKQAPRKRGRHAPAAAAAAAAAAAGLDEPDAAAAAPAAAAGAWQQPQARRPKRALRKNAAAAAAGGEDEEVLEEPPALGQEPQQHAVRQVRKRRAAAAAAGSPPAAAAAAAEAPMPHRQLRGRKGAAAGAGGGDSPPAAGGGAAATGGGAGVHRQAAARGAKPRGAARRAQQAWGETDSDEQQQGSESEQDEGSLDSSGDQDPSPRKQQQQRQQPARGRKRQQQQQQQDGGTASDEGAGNTGTGTDWDMFTQHTASPSEPSAERPTSSAGLTPSSGGYAMQQQQQEQEQQRMSESAGSNWLPPEGPPGAAGAVAAGTGAAATGSAGEGDSLRVSHQGSRSAGSEGLSLDIRFREQLGKGGFGAVHKVFVRATGPNSLAGLKLSGPLDSSLKTLVKKNKFRTKGGDKQWPAGVRGYPTAPSRSRAGSVGVDDGAGGGGGTWVPMALKVALSFEQLSREMQDNFKQAAAFDANVQQRMREEYELMNACAASPHILDAFVMGSVVVGGAWRPCILMELSPLGDAEKVFIIPANPYYKSPPLGIDSLMAQRIVRQAALALRDLHSLAGCMHLDVKVNNLLVFGTRQRPIIKLCDMGCAKRRRDEPRYGPASGTKDWQAPEQMAANPLDGSAAGRLDYCTDSWALGLLVLSLRKGQQPFWWIKQDGRIPSEMPDELRASLSQPSSPYAQDSDGGAKLTRQEVAFVTACMASSSDSRPPPKDLLQDQAYLSTRYRGG